jgi:hypothetical protein
MSVNENLFRKVVSEVLGLADRVAEARKILRNGRVQGCALIFSNPGLRTALGNRHNAKPGITGWAQIHGLRGNTDLAERINYDVWYMENWSLILDVQIMAMTFFKRQNAA